MGGVRRVGNLPVERPDAGEHDRVGGWNGPVRDGLRAGAAIDGNRALRVAVGGVRHGAAACERGVTFGQDRLVEHGRAGRDGDLGCRRVDAVAENRGDRRSRAGDLRVDRAEQARQIARLNDVVVVGRGLRQQLHQAGIDLAGAAAALADGDGVDRASGAHRIQEAIQVGLGRPLAAVGRRRHQTVPPRLIGIRPAVG